jgi:hypothetical protein
MKEYRVYEDKFSVGYMAMLKKHENYNKYLKIIMRPGGIRPAPKKGEPIRAESLYSD